LKPVPEITIVIPALNEEANVELLYEEICDVLETVGRPAEILFVDDGSTDGTFDRLCRLHEVDARVKVIRFQRNFGKAAAYSAGFEHASGRHVITMDGDLQDDPADLPRFLAKLDEGFDFVVGWKHRGKGPWHKSLPSRLFNIVVGRTTGLQLHDLDCPFRGFRREVVDSIKLYGELYRYIPVLVASKGFRIGEVPIENRERRHGRSKFGAERFLRGGLDLFTILFITRYLGRPLHLFGGVGLLSATLGLLAIVGLYLVKFIAGIPIHNTPFLFALAVLAMVLGVQLFSVGLVCQLLIELNKRPGDNYQIATKIW
jgi:glycosyltransferase involved in cell wall biosynthesis